VFNKIKPPYNINQASQELALQALDNIDQVNGWIKETVEERNKLQAGLEKLPIVELVYPSDANFLLVKTVDAKGIYNKLVAQGIIVRDRSKVELCAGCLRITIGTPEENVTLLNTLKSIPA
jgi:histidinol-phosphate aminotransferase